MVFVYEETIAYFKVINIYIYPPMFSSRSPKILAFLVLRSSSNKMFACGMRQGQGTFFFLWILSSSSKMC